MALLEVKELCTQFFTREGVVQAVDRVSFSLEERSILGLVGESGCGKTMTSLSIMGLVPNPGRVVGGEVLLSRQDLRKKSEREMQRIRGNEIAMIFQEPMTSLNPVFTVGNQVAEAARIHQKLSPREARDRAIESLKRVGIPSPEVRVDEYPHQLSGGMRQRVMIAMALCCEPRVLIADEPTTALDVTLQAQILELLDQLRDSMGMAVILITHDLGVVAEFASEVAVMYAGQIVEYTGVMALFRDPKHPYTAALLRSIPRIDDHGSMSRLRAIDGTVPDPLRMPAGCRFGPRCPDVMPQCGQPVPMAETEPGHLVRCVKCVPARVESLRGAGAAPWR